MRTKFSHKRTMRSFAWATSFIALTTAASAQSQAPLAIEEILVTAQKRAQSINDIGITINAFTGDALKERGIMTAEQLSQVTPGLQVTDTGSQGVPIYTIRGVGFNNPYGNSSSTVGLYIDEVAIPYTMASRGAIFDMERIEVLKGPQGDLYGRNTTAGQVNFLSRKPTRDFEAGVSAEYGRFSTVDLEAYVSGPISDTVQGRLSGKVVRSSGWQRSLSRPEEKPLGEQDQASIRGQLNFDIKENSSLLVKLHYVRDQSENTSPTAFNGLDIGLAQPFSNPTFGAPMIYTLGDNRVTDWTPGFRPVRDNELLGGSARLNIDMGNVMLSSITAYDKFKRSETNDWDGAAANDSASINDTDLDMFSQELRLSSNDDGPFTWIVGGYYSYDKINEDYNYFMSDSVFGFALGINELDTRYRQKTESMAGFAHAEWQATDQLRLIGGIRYTEEDRSFFGCTYDRDGTLAAATNGVIGDMIRAAGLPNPPFVPDGSCAVYDDRPDSPNYGTFNPFDEDLKTKKFMWKAGINFDATDDVLLFATVSAGFKSGGFNGANANTQTQIKSYKPEKLLAFETGVKAKAFDGRMQFNASAFYYDYKDKQESGLAVTFVGNISGITNIPKSRVYGAEVEMNWLINENFSVDLGAAYVNSKIKEWMRVSRLSSMNNIIYEDASGASLPNSPEWSLNATPKYRWDISSNLYAQAAADFIYRDSTSGGGELLNATESYWLVNARIAIADQNDKWMVSLWGKNILNEYYYNFQGTGGNGPYVRVVGMPATYGIRLDYKF